MFWIQATETQVTQTESIICEEEDSFNDEFNQLYNKLLETDVLTEKLLDHHLLMDANLENDCLSEDELYFSESDDDTAEDIKAMVLL